MVAFFKDKRGEMSLGILFTACCSFKSALCGSIWIYVWIDTVNSALCQNPLLPLSFLPLPQLDPPVDTACARQRHRGDAWPGAKFKSEVFFVSSGRKSFRLSGRSFKILSHLSASPKITVKWLPFPTCFFLSGRLSSNEERGIHCLFLPFLPVSRLPFLRGRTVAPFVATPQ